MVVGTDIEARVVLAVVPADEAVVRPYGRRGVVEVMLLHLDQQPAAGDDGMRLEELRRGGRFHFRGDDAHQVVLHRQAVDGEEASVSDQEMQLAAERLCLPTLPVKAHTDGDIPERERGVGVTGAEEECRLLHAVDADLSFPDGGLPDARHDGSAVRCVASVQLEGEAVGLQDADLYERFAHDRLFLRVSTMRRQSASGMPTSAIRAAAVAAVSRSKSSRRGVMMSPPMSSAPGLTSGEG